MANLSEKLQDLGLITPEILLPSADIDQAKWAVVACDQHTSDRSYWESVETQRSGSPSTLDLVFPEVYLEDDDSEGRITSIQEHMEEYISKGILKSHGNGWMYIRRTTAASGLRQGLLVAVDLEAYDFSEGSTSLIRATEGTILDRLPPRIAVRKDAPLELPHIMILIDDPERTVIEPLAKSTDSLEKTYDVELMLGGGKLEGYWVGDETHIAPIADALEKLASKETAKARYGTDKPLLFAMGDGNHSLATAKSVWEQIKLDHIKAGGNVSELSGHPARYALAELVNIYSEGLRFEPIHRTMFSIDIPSLVTGLGKIDKISNPHIEELSDEAAAKAFLTKEANGVVFFSDEKWYALNGEYDLLAPGLVDRAFAACAPTKPSAKIDFIHGWEHNLNISRKNPGSVAAFFNVIAREDLFAYVIRHGALPRKAFSMGDAEEKRYYFEARAVR